MKSFSISPDPAGIGIDQAHLHGVGASRDVVAIEEQVHVVYATLFR